MLLPIYDRLALLMAALASTVHAEPNAASMMFMMMMMMMEDKSRFPQMAKPMRPSAIRAKGQIILDKSALAAWPSRSDH